MTYLSLQRTRQQTDLLATDLLPECPGCHELCPAGATVCECGTKLFPADTGTLTLAEAFWSNVDRSPGGCWLWTGSHLPAGYGKFYFGGATHYAHRLSYELSVGPIPDGLVIDHLCRTPACVRPSHLEPVTHQENVRRGIVGQEYATRTHCPQGHEYTPENTINRPRAGRIERQCRACKNDSARRYRASRNTTAPERASLDGPRAQGQKEISVMGPSDEPRCTCGGNGICTYCDLQSYEPLPLEARGMMIALDMTEAALRRPANVVPIDRHSRRVS